MLPDAAELGLGDDGGKRLLHPHRLGLVLGVHAPEHCAGVRLVGEDAVDAGPAPELPPGAGDALVVEGADDFERPISGLRHVEHAPDDAGRIRVDLQGGPLLGSVLRHDPVVAEGGVAGNPEASRCGLPHPPRDLLGQDIGYPIDTKHCGIRGPSIWMQRAGTVASATAGIRPEAPPTTAARVPRF